MGRLQPSPPQFKSRGDVNRNGYRRGKQPKFNRYVFETASESIELSNQMTAAGFTDTELAKAAQTVFENSLKKCNLFIDENGDVQHNPEKKKREYLPKVDLNIIGNIDDILI